MCITHTKANSHLPHLLPHYGGILLLAYLWRWCYSVELCVFYYYFLWLCSPFVLCFVGNRSVLALLLKKKKNIFFFHISQLAIIFYQWTWSSEYTVVVNPYWYVEKFIPLFVCMCDVLITRYKTIRLIKALTLNLLR